MAIGNCPQTLVAVLAAGGVVSDGQSQRGCASPVRGQRNNPSKVRLQPPFEALQGRCLQMNAFIRPWEEVVALPPGQMREVGLAQGQDWTPPEVRGGPGAALGGGCRPGHVCGATTSGLASRPGALQARRAALGGAAAPAPLQEAPVQSRRRRRGCGSPWPAPSSRERPAMVVPPAGALCALLCALCALLPRAAPALAPAPAAFDRLYQGAVSLRREQLYAFNYSCRPGQVRVLPAGARLPPRRWAAGFFWGGGGTYLIPILQHPVLLEDPVSPSLLQARHLDHTESLSPVKWCWAALS